MLTRPLVRRCGAALLTAVITLAVAAPAQAGEYQIYACSVPGASSPSMGPWTVVSEGDSSFLAMGTTSCTGGVFGRSDEFSPSASYPMGGGFAGFEARVPNGLPVELRNLRLKGQISYTRAAGSAGSFETSVTPDERVLCAMALCTVDHTLAFDDNTRWARIGVTCVNAGPCQTNKTYRQTWDYAILTAAESDAPNIAPDGGALLAGGGQRGTRAIRYAAADAESGVARVSVSLGGTVVVDRLLTDDAALCPRHDWNVCPTTHAEDLGVDTTQVADGAHVVTLKVTDAAGNVATADAGIVTVDNVPAPTAVEAPAIAGAPYAGELLTATTGRFTGAAPGTPLLRWKRCSSGGCEAIPGATGASYRATAEDVGRQLVVEATAANAIGETTAADSAPTAVVATRGASSGGGGSSGTPATAAAAVRPSADNGVNASTRAKLTALLVHGKATRTVRYGSTATVNGRLVDEQGRPISGASVLVSARTRLAAQPDRPVTTVVTNDRGEFAFRAAPGPSRELTFGYRASSADRELTSTTKVTVLVQAGVTFRATPSTLRNGQRVRFSGTVRGKPVARNGLLVDLQVRVRGRWQSFLPGAVRTTRGGAFRASYRFRRTRRTTTYRFRAVARQDSAYPYVSGRSRETRVRVRAGR